MTANLFQEAEKGAELSESSQFDRLAFSYAHGR